MEVATMESLATRSLNQRGSALVVTILILAILTLIGISVTNTTRIETIIAGNEKFHKIAFYNADTGVHVTPKLISYCVDNGEAQQGLTNINYLDDNGDPDATINTLDIFFYELMGFDALLGRPAHDAVCDTSFFQDGHEVEVDIDRSGQQSLAGGGVEFASGAEGIGVGSAGGVALLYTLDSYGDGPATAESEIVGVYRKVVAVAGGL
jgi:hypothetical protein